MRFSSNPNDIGNKLGPKLVQLISDTVVATKRKLLHTEHQVRVGAMQEIIDRAGREVADLYRPVIADALGDTEIKDQHREMIEKITSGRHQWQALAGLSVISGGTSSAIGTILSNFLADSVRAIVAKDPLLVPAPDVLVQLGVKGAMPWSDVYYLCAGQGYSRSTVDSLAAAVTSWPDVPTILELLRRKLLPLDHAQSYMERNGIALEVQNTLLKLAEVPLSPADLADMTVRGIKTEGQAAAIAAESGVSAADFHSLVLDTGEPPGLMQLLEGYRRGFTDQAGLVHGIRQSRYRDEWIPFLEKLRYAPMSVADAVNGVVQNHLTQSEGASIADQNGLEPGAFRTLYETAGEPLSRTEMEDLYNRGLATEGEVKQALRESRVKNKYIDHAFSLHQRIIPVRSIAMALEHGAVDHATAIRKIMDNGYSQADAEIEVNSGSARKLQSYKNKVVTAVESSYEENLIPQADALALIIQMGYERSEAEFILQSAEFRRSARIVNQVATNVRGRYVAHWITRNQASNDLDRIGIPSAQRDFMLSLWDIEYAAHTKHLTEAQVVKAVKLQLITLPQGLKRLMDMGYTAEDAALLTEGA